MRRQVVDAIDHPNNEDISPMIYVLMFSFALALIFSMIAVHELGHYLAGLTAGIPARDMKIVLLAFPQHVALRDGNTWVSPVTDIARYVEVSRGYFATRWAAFRYVAGGFVVGTMFSVALCIAAMESGHRGIAIWVAGISLAMYLVNVLLMDIPRAIRFGHAAGDTSGLWQIAKLPTVSLTVLVLAIDVTLVVWAC